MLSEKAIKDRIEKSRQQLDKYPNDPEASIYRARIWEAEAILSMTDDEYFE